MGRIDYESETLIPTTNRCFFDDAFDLAHALRADGFNASEDGTGRGTPLVPVAFDMPVIPIDMRQASRGATMTNNRPEGSSGGAPGTGIGKSGDPSPTIASSHTPAVAFDLRDHEGGSQFEGPHDTANIRAASGGSSRSYLAQTYGVRRLMPIECERLQGYPDNHTLIQFRGKPAADGPRYKAIGNSMAVPVMRWILSRIERLEQLMGVVPDDDDFWNSPIIKAAIALAWRDDDGAAA